MSVEIKLVRNGNSMVIDNWPEVCSYYRNNNPTWYKAVTEARLHNLSPINTIRFVAYAMTIRAEKLEKELLNYAKTTPIPSLLWANNYPGKAKQD